MIKQVHVKRVNQLLMLSSFALLLFVFRINSNTIQVKEPVYLIYDFQQMTFYAIIVFSLYVMSVTAYAVLLYSNNLKLGWNTIIQSISISMGLYVIIRFLILFFTVDIITMQYMLKQNNLVFVSITIVSFLIQVVLYVVHQRVYSIRQETHKRRVLIICMIPLVLAVVLSGIPYAKPVLDLEKDAHAQLLGNVNGRGYLRLSIYNDVTEQLPLLQGYAEEIHLDDLFELKILDSKQKQEYLYNGEIQYKITYDPHLDTIFTIKNKDTVYTYKVTGLQDYIVDVSAFNDSYPTMRQLADERAKQFSLPYDTYEFIGSELMYDFTYGSEIRFYYLISKQEDNQPMYYLYETYVKGLQNDINEYVFHDTDDEKGKAIQFDTKDVVYEKYQDKITDTYSEHIIIE